MRIGRPAAFATAGIALVLAGCWTATRAWSAMRAHPYFTIAEVEVSGNSRVGRQQLLYWAGLRPGMSLWDAVPDEIAARLAEHPDLARVSVRREFPRRLVLSVRERQRVAIAVLDDLYFVDRQGHLATRLSAGDSRDLPLITGLGLADLEKGGAVLLRRAVRLLRLYQREGFGQGVSEVHVEPEGGVTLIPLRQRVAIVLGWGAWRLKLARAKRVLEAWKDQEARLAVLDASFRNQVIVHAREKPLPRQPVGRQLARTGVRA